MLNWNEKSYILYTRLLSIWLRWFSGIWPLKVLRPFSDIVNKSFFFCKKLKPLYLPMIYNSPKAFMCSLKQIKVYLRNNEVFLGTLKKYDKHFNLILKTPKGKKIFIRGDGIIYIVRVNWKFVAMSQVIFDFEFLFHLPFITIKNEALNTENSWS